MEEGIRIFKETIDFLDSFFVVEVRTVYSYVISVTQL